MYNFHNIFATNKWTKVPGHSVLTVVSVEPEVLVSPEPYLCIRLGAQRDHRTHGEEQWVARANYRVFFNLCFPP